MAEIGLYFLLNFHFLFIQEYCIEKANIKQFYFLFYVHIALLGVYRAVYIIEVEITIML